MAEYTFADVIINPEDPRVELGAEYYWADTPRGALDCANYKRVPLRLFSVDTGGTRTAPFYFLNGSLSGYAVCIIRKKEPEKKYVPFDLSKKEDRARLRGAWIRFKETGRERCITGIFLDENPPYVEIGDYGFEPDYLLENYEFVDGSPCGNLVEEEI